MTLDNDSEPTNTALHDDTNEHDDEYDEEEEITSKEEEEDQVEEEEEDALALLARSKARMTEVEAERQLDEVKEQDRNAMHEDEDEEEDEDIMNDEEEVVAVSEEVEKTETKSESETNEKPAAHNEPAKPNQHHELISPAVVNKEIKSPAAARTVHLKAKPSNLAEEAAALLAMSKARLMNGEASQDGARSSSSGAAGVEGVKKQSMMIKPLEDDEVIESSSEEEEEEEVEEAEVEVEHLDGADEFETRVSEKSNRGDKDLQQGGADVSMNGHKAKDVVDQSLSNSDEEEEEIDDEAIQSQARAYAAAMLTVANVSESHNKRSSHREDDTIKKSDQGEQMEDVKSFVDTKYLNNLDALPPHLINALLHEEAMFAAEKAALEGKDRHVFDLKQASDLSSEVRIFCYCE